MERRCSFEGCANKHRAHGLCSSHLDQLARGKELTPLRGPHGQLHETCTVPGCTNKHAANGLCAGHKTQRQRDKPLTPLPKRGPPKLRFTDERGYVWIKRPDHPNAKRNNAKKGSTNGYVQEHIFVMSELLGRPLRPEESVHHRNGLRDDNRPANLELWSRHQPTGARVADRVAWARWLLEQYGNEFPPEHTDRQG
jgi:HNH endonuclease